MYSPALKEAYQNDLKAYRDNRNVLETAKIEKRNEIARNLKQLGIPLETIAQATGMSIDEIKKLK
jgi:predicted transposase YdaD